MRIVQIPTGEYYLIKSASQGLGAFLFRAKSTGFKGGQIMMNSSISVPPDLMGKKFRFRVEIIKPKK